MSPISAADPQDEHATVPIHGQETPNQRRRLDRVSEPNLICKQLSLYGIARYASHHCQLVGGRFDRGQE